MSNLTLMDDPNQAAINAENNPPNEMLMYLKLPDSSFSTSGACLICTFKVDAGFGSPRRVKYSQPVVKRWIIAPTLRGFICPR